MKKLSILMVLFIIALVSAVFADGESPDSLPLQDISTGCRLITADYTLDEDYKANGDCLVIGSSNIILDGNGHTLTGNGTGIGITAIGTTGITIKNFKIRGFKTSISIQDADNSIIENNEIVSTSDYSKGISSVSSDNVVFKDNKVVMENQESAGVYITGHKNMVFDGNEVTCKNKIFFEKTACVHLTNIYDSEIKNNAIEYKSGNFHVKGECVKVGTGQNNKFHDNTIKGYCPALTSSGESNSQYYSNMLKTEGIYYGSYSRGFTFADGANNLIKDNEASASAQVFNINTAYSTTSPAGYVLTNLKLDNGLAFSATKITQLSVYGSKIPNVIVPDYANKTGLGKFGVYSYVNTPGYIEFSVNYETTDEIDEDTLGLYYYYSNKWTPLPGTRMDKENDIIYVDYIKFPTAFSGNSLNLGIWADVKEAEPEPTDLCQSDCTKGDNIAYLECESHEGCQDVQMNFLDPSGTGNVVAGCDNRTLDSNYYFSHSYCIGNVIYEQFSCKKNQGVSGTIVNVNPEGRTCENGCENGACIDEVLNDTEPVDGTCPGNSILVCHNENNPHELCVANESISAHLAHADYLGACVSDDKNQGNKTPGLNESTETEENETEEETETEEEIGTEEETETDEEEPTNGTCPAEKAFICHVKNKEHELCVSISALDSHLSHGDYEGRCKNEKKEEKIIDLVSQDKKAEILSEGTVRKIEFKTKKEKKDIKITVRTRNTAPPQVKEHKRKVYNYITIDHPDVSNDEIEDSKVEFGVEKKWVASTGKPEDIVLSKFENEWRDLKTNYLRSDDLNYYFESDTEGFSEFAINMQSTVSVPIPTINETIALNENAAKEKIVPEKSYIDIAKRIWPVFFLISLIIYITIFYTKRNRLNDVERKKKEREPYKILIEYVDDLKKKGNSVDQIKSKLNEAGWEKEDVEKVLKFS